jgi:hypothetical protein
MDVRQESKFKEDGWRDQIQETQGLCVDGLLSLEETACFHMMLK